MVSIDDYLTCYFFAVTLTNHAHRFQIDNIYSLLFLFYDYIVYKIVYA